MYLESIKSPADLKKLSLAEQQYLAGEIRQRILSTVSRTGGHLASSLGTVELTLALHSVPAEAPEPEPSAPVEVVLTEPVFRRSGESHRPVGRNLSHPSICHTKKSPACRKARSRRGIWFL